MKDVYACLNKHLRNNVFINIIIIIFGDPTVASSAANDLWHRFVARVVNGSTMSPPTGQTW